MINKIDIEILRHFKKCNSTDMDKLELRFDNEKLGRRLFLFMQKGYFEKCGDIESYKLNEIGLQLLSDMEEEYKNQEIKPTQVTNISNSIVGNTVHGDVNQSIDSSSNKTNNTPAKADNNIIKKVLIGIVIGVLVGLILYYVFKIN